MPANARFRYLYSSSLCAFSGSPFMIAFDTLGIVIPSDVGTSVGCLKVFIFQFI